MMMESDMLLRGGITTRRTQKSMAAMTMAITEDRVPTEVMDATATHMQALGSRTITHRPAGLNMPSAPLTTIRISTAVTTARRSFAAHRTWTIHRMHFILRTHTPAILLLPHITDRKSVV